MSITDVQMLFQFVGGLGMFLYGMNAMADGLQKSAGHRMQQLLGALTKNRLMGVILAGVAAAKLNIDCSGIVNLVSIGSIVLFLALLGSLAYVCMGGKKKA